jgi:hypothetical protein
MDFLIGMLNVSSQFRKIEFPPPNEEARLDILKIHSRKMNLTRSVKTIFIFLLEVGRSALIAIPALSRFGFRHLSKIIIWVTFTKEWLKTCPTKIIQYNIFLFSCWKLTFFSSFF